jgi:hypothetical protein
MTCKLRNGSTRFSIYEFARALDDYPNYLYTPSILKYLSRLIFYVNVDYLFY